MPDKRTETTLLQDLWKKVGKVDLAGYGNIEVCSPHNFTYPQFVSDAEFLANTSNDAMNKVLMERIEILEKQVEGRDLTMMNMLSNINQHIMKNRNSSVPNSYESVATWRGFTNSGDAELVYTFAGKCNCMKPWLIIINYVYRAITLEDLD